MSEIAKPKSRDPSSLDPMTEPWWTLPMAISWIIWRTPDEVRTQWRKYDEEFRDLNRLPDGTRSRTGLRSLYDIIISTFDDALPATFIVDGAAARDDLWRRLQDGELIANGIPVGSETRRFITKMEWLDLDSFDPNVGWPVDAIGRGHKHILRFNSVAVPSNDVVRIWSDLDTANAGGVTQAKAKRGPKFQYDWKEGEQYFYRLMDSMGDLDDRQEWSAQADIERMILKHMKKHGGGEPSVSLVQEHVAKWLTDFRAAANTQ
jgi:hypothetical protein